MSRSDRNYRVHPAKPGPGHPRHVICAVTSSKEQQIAERMAAYRRRGYLIEARAKALGLVVA